MHTIRNIEIRPFEEKFDHLARTCQASFDASEMETFARIKPILAEVYSHQADDLIVFNNQADIAALTVTELGLGATAVFSVLFYDLITHRQFAAEKANEITGKNLMIIIHGLQKISVFFTNKQSSQAENFRQFLLNLAVDVRVVLVKLAERLYLMRNMKKFDREGQLRLASEGSYLYAPLAHRLGLYKVKSEMEDIWLKITEYDTYREIADRLEQTARERNRIIAEFIKPVKLRLDQEGFEFEIKGRPKSIFSIYNKIKKNKVAFDDIYDKFAIRIILNSKPENEKADCWKVYSLITEQYQPNPLRLRDWISVPKSNGYESLHTTVVTSDGHWVEVQIRTVRMDEIAEKGFAAHWKYKGGKTDGTGLDDWLTRVREVLESPDASPEHVIDNFKLSLYSKEIFIFTPKGDLKKFAKGATVLDFAYDIHSEVGSTCMGAKINGKNVTIRHELNNGDKVEILTSKNQKPSNDWLNFVVTSKAKSKIKIALNESVLREAETGKDLIKRRFKNWKISYNDQIINRLLRHYKIKNSVDFYQMVATEKINIAEIRSLVREEPSATEAEPAPAEHSFHEPATQEPQSFTDYLIIDDKLENVDYKLARCCNPIFGDEIFGFVSINEGIKIHRVSCPNAPQMMSRYGYRVIRARWNEAQSHNSFLATISITGMEEFGILTRINEVINGYTGVALRNISFDSHDGLLEGQVKVNVKDKSHLEGLIKKLQVTKGVIKATRREG